MAVQVIRLERLARQTTGDRRNPTESGRRYMSVVGDLRRNLAGRDHTVSVVNNSSLVNVVVSWCARLTQFAWQYTL